MSFINGDQCSLYIHFHDRLAPHRGRVLKSGPSPRRVANQRIALGGRLGMVGTRR